jgi:2-polyprenyl-6-methoxyphenol hydroxylase-like FAD-dependent oxidoreductase
MQRRPEIAVIGAGIGGLAVAGLLARQGANVTVYEQAAAFERLGAGIQMSPNAMHVLRALGLEPLLRQLAFSHPLGPTASGTRASTWPISRSAPRPNGATARPIS